MTIYAGRAEKGRPDEQIARHFVRPGQGSEEGAADDLCGRDDDHQTEHQHDGDAANPIERITDRRKNFLEYHRGMPPSLE